MERDTSTVKLALGDPAPYFCLPATDGRIYALPDFRDAAALVVVFTANHCPYAQAYEQRLVQLNDRFSPDGVRFLAVCSNDGDSYPEDSFEQMLEKSQRLGFPYPYLHDENQNVAKAYDAACTPEAYLFDKELKLRYHGLIDDCHEDVSQVSQHYLADAIIAILEGAEPTPARTAAIGCSIKWKR